MEEKNKASQAKQSEDQRAMSYDELRKTCSELFTDNKKLSYQIEQMKQALEQSHKMLESRDFDYTSFMLSMMFKVVEHPEMYSDEFVKWVVANIESSLKTFVSTMQEQANEAEVKEEADKKQD